MTKSPEFDVAAAHRYFSGRCFNQAWDLIEKADRSHEDDRLMFALNQASIFHWLSRPDCDNKHLSIGYWQASRIQAILGNGVEAQRYADICLSYSGDLEPFFLGYAHEALARAAVLIGNSAAAAEHLSQARANAALVSRKQDRELLLNDLATLE
jgi:hypothetical protein